MAVADLVAEWFETELLRATVAARGIFGAFAGPWSAGTSLGVILQAATDSNAAGPATFVRGGMGALTQALAAAARGRRRDPHGRDGRANRHQGRRAPRASCSRRARRSRRARSSRTPIRRRRSSAWSIPSTWIRTSSRRFANYRSMGAVAKVNLALSGLPGFSSPKAAGDAKTAPRGAHPHRPGHRLSRARLRRREVRRLLAAPLLRRHDPDDRRSVARARRPARPVGHTPSSRLTS